VTLARTCSEDPAPGSSLYVLKGGRALLYPVYESTYECGDGLVSDYPDQTANWKDHVIMWGKDLRRSIDCLETREDIDADRLAFEGVSWGAAMAPIMIAVEPRIKAGIVVVLSNLAARGRRAALRHAGAGADAHGQRYV
jgi:poly(3-hydroxybutyrate) depolymerase